MTLKFAKIWTLVGSALFFLSESAHAFISQGSPNPSPEPLNRRLVNEELPPEDNLACILEMQSCDSSDPLDQLIKDGHHHFPFRY